MTSPSVSRSKGQTPIAGDAGAIFDLAPVSMWLEDFSAVKAQFDAWRAEGVTNLRAHLMADPRRVAQCSSRIRVLRVNDRTLELFEAESEAHLVANLDRVFRDDMLLTHIGELCQLWDGAGGFSSAAVNYTLGGRRLDIQLRATVLPGHETDLSRVLLTAEDVTAREEALRGELLNRQYAEGLFEHSPVSLWVEDFSRIREMLEDLRFQGITDLRVFTDVHPEFVLECMSEIRVIEVNRATLDMFCAPDAPTLLENLQHVFRDGMQAHFREQLIELWNGRLVHSREVLNYALDGTDRNAIMQFSVIPGREADWSRVLVSLTDITARKKAEAYLVYLGKHDVLTGLYNRGHYIDMLNRLTRQRISPVSAVVLDINGLKAVNDDWGHDAGDALLRRIGEVLKEAAGERWHAARVGGDEFVLLMPRADAAETATTLAAIAQLVEVNNQFYSGMPMSLSMAASTQGQGEALEAMMRRADQAMYAQKRDHYARAAVGG
ncbi:sensor domain-containing diguanylate cyclase [Frigidibacter sp. MR17.24]|uniref:sensor domain-containing diguanylate cyclase n=1 Tax=Frigidibacter sp. MR17.24 TaxID=3127345 RepID=UPI003012C04F